MSQSCPNVLQLLSFYINWASFFGGIKLKKRKDFLQTFFSLKIFLKEEEMGKKNFATFFKLLWGQNWDLKA